MKKNIQYSIFNSVQDANKLISQYSARCASRGLALSRSKGFTVIELLVTMAIFSVLTGVVLAQYRDYTTDATFANASESIVLALRQAQVYGAGGKKNVALCSGGASLFSCRYGVSFSKDSNKFTMFVDTNGNQVYDQGQGEEIETVVWDAPISVKELTCATLLCSNGTMNIIFARPSPDALITDIANATNFHDSGGITVTNGTKSNIVVISRAGQISIQ